MNEHTPDGILKSDWEVLEILAANYVYSDTLNESLIKNSILNYVDDLISKYGQLPSLLATRADYVGSNDESKQLLELAYQLANTACDYKNKTLISSSLAELYYIELNDVKKGEYWIDKLSQDLVFYYDEDEYEVWKSLQ